MPARGGKSSHLDLGLLGFGEEGGLELVLDVLQALLLGGDVLGDVPLQGVDEPRAEDEPGG